MVQSSKFAELRRAWEAKGSPECGHTHTGKEYFTSSQTGDIGCLSCGAVWWYTEPKPGSAQDESSG